MIYGASEPASSPPRETFAIDFQESYSQRRARSWHFPAIQRVLWDPQDPRRWLSPGSTDRLATALRRARTDSTLDKQRWPDRSHLCRRKGLTRSHHRRCRWMYLIWIFTFGFVNTWRAAGNCSAPLKALKAIVRKDAGLRWILWILLFFVALDFVLLGNVAVRSVCCFSSGRDRCKSWWSPPRRPSRDVVRWFQGNIPHGALVLELPVSR